MKRVLGAVLALGIVVGGAVGFQAAAREQQYRALLSRGDQAMHDGQAFGAIEAFSGAIGLRPESMLAHLRRGETYRQRGDLDAATRDFRKAAALDPSATRPLEALGDVLYQRKRFKSAADAYQSRLDLDDRSEQVTYKLALARFRDGDVDAALAALAQTLRLNDRLPDAHYLLGLCLRERRRVTDAIKALETVLTLSPGMIPAREELASLYASVGRRTDELEQLQYIALLERTNVERQVAVGLAQARTGHRELAVLTLGNALGRTSDDPPIYAALGKVWFDMADERTDALTKAIEALERVASSPGGSSEVMTTYGRALLKANQPEAAERVLHQAVTTYPIDPVAFLAYADAAERQNHLEAARAALITHGTLFGADGGFVARATKLGQLSLLLNEPATAAGWFRRALEAAPTDLRLMASLVDVQIRAGDHESARALIARGLERDPENALLIALSRRLPSRD